MSAKRIQRIFAQMVAWMNPTPTPAAALTAKLWQRMASIVVVCFIYSTTCFMPYGTVTHLLIPYYYSLSLQWIRVPHRRQSKDWLQLVVRLTSQPNVHMHYYKG